MRLSCGLLLFAALNGCGGYYILTVPDQLAPAGGDAKVVVRLQRNDFFVLAFPVKDAAIQFRLAGRATPHSAHTDDRGYAGSVVEAPEKPGEYVIVIEHQDREGEELRTDAPLFVWDTARKVIAVDIDCLPQSRRRSGSAAGGALAVLARDANLLYLTRRSVNRHGKAHKWLRANGYPDGPILLWKRQRWHIDRLGRLPKLVVESRLVSQLGELRETFKGLTAGVCTSWLAARGFAEAGLHTVIVGDGNVDVENFTRRTSWSTLAASGI